MKEGAAPPKFSEKDIVEFIFFPVVNEGCRVIDEGEAGACACGREALPWQAGQLEAGQLPCRWAAPGTTPLPHRA